MNGYISEQLDIDEHDKTKITQPVKLAMEKNVTTMYWFFFNRCFWSTVFNNNPSKMPNMELKNKLQNQLQVLFLQPK